MDPKQRLDRRLLGLLVACALLLTLAGCLPGENPAVRTAPPGGQPAGFLLGLWHGFVAPFSFVVSLFTDSVNVYEVHNNGNWYDFGFVTGAGILFGGGGAGARRRRR
mgnify:CR=1 FL=1